MLMPPPHGLLRGNAERSRSRTGMPAFASVRAAVAPAGPAPTTRTCIIWRASMLGRLGPLELMSPGELRAAPAALASPAAVSPAAASPAAPPLVAAWRPSPALCRD